MKADSQSGSVNQMQTSPLDAEAIAGEREAAAFLSTLRSWPSDGNELYAVLNQQVRSEHAARLRGFCRALQRELLTGQKEWPREAAKKSKGAKWMVSRKPAAS